ncbi:hypothetical protein OCV46_00005 [Anthropogastromicrobium aceti]|uniref:hypothetical protein n=1 Tax=Anthropogastromicrobium aceti TaxID=2981768 RepID=UPI00082140E9|nr:hypothetical protein [Anthropogastromicrobium aceti]MCU6782336.1 hypothetical protein [Anthropogastromicrobium aceti]SCI80684.1 Uncharacterised protein [uncultured Lachnospira sp.]
MKKTNDFSGWVTAERNFEKKWMIDSTGEEVCHEVPGHKLHFYLEKKGKKVYLFTQSYNIAVAREFTSGKTADELRRYHKWGRNPRVDKTIEKIPMYITYIKQEGLV